MRSGQYAFVILSKPREFAVRSLLRADQPGDFLEHRLDGDPGWAALSPADRRLAHELIFGVVRWSATLDWLIDRRTHGRPQKPELRQLLRTGLYQLFWLDRIPAHAAVNETVQLARDIGFGSQSGFVNAVLRGSLREQESVRKELLALRESDPAIGWSHPAWLIDRWQRRWGWNDTTRLLALNNTPPGTFARRNTLRTDAISLTDRWRKELVDFVPVHRDWCPDGILFELKDHPSLATLGSFVDGGFYVQDPSTLLAVQQLDPQPGDVALDFCSAPGGKTTWMAACMKNQGRLLAHDTSRDRLRWVLENCRRLGVTCVETTAADAGLVAEPSTFDRILVDAPCSNTGVLRRRIELRWRIRAEEIDRLATEQLKLLTQAAPLLKTGGTLVYSTCSLELEENSEVAREFSAKHPAFQLVAERELLPFRDGADGVYVARWVRKV